MGYYCTVPQCTSLAGKTKNVKFHRFPRDKAMSDKWNNILKRGKPVTQYSKVCSLHFTQADYNVTTMGQWKTLSKEAIPTQNLPKLNPDGSVMVIRKSRTIKYKEQKKEESPVEKHGKWAPVMALGGSQDRVVPNNMDSQDSALSYRLQKLNDLANMISPHSNQSASPTQEPPKKQDAIMQTDPIQGEDEDPLQNSYSESSEKSYSPDMEYTSQYKDQEFQEKDQGYQKDQFEKDHYEKDQSYKDDEYSKDTQYPKELPEPEAFSKDGYQKFEAKDYTKPTEDYIPQTNEEYNKEAEKYALERKSHNGYEKGIDYQKQLPIENGYQKIQDIYAFTDKPPEYEPRTEYAAAPYQAYGAAQRHDLQLLQEQHRINENQNFFNENHIKQEIDFGNEEDKFLYERNKEQVNKYDEAEYSRAVMEQRLLQQMQLPVKQEPDSGNGCESVMQPQTSPYYNTNGHTNVTGGYYEQLSQLSRPGPELLIAKQNALAAHTQLWQNTKRPFFYSSSSHYNAPQLLHRYEDLTRIQQ